MAIRYGQFCNSVIQFLIIAWSVFLAVKAMTKLSTLRQGREAPAGERSAPAGSSAAAPKS
ncbi:hypothetical protein MAMC_01477 [Methylacidimicrobium cyclopophantes]|uniref:Uncharacterized protein n=1 Tax=Methylacidimicrobium cyclopophantes TaxID=1041766 RepID=A0A5E6MH13_9BACT|nr:MscL family protein [Methylacidimicrobium cyclopophantes]VVM07175.1 hypothetical protein MAMC_01477 [Methylacidimicrobium cyclopophantes]